MNEEADISIIIPTYNRLWCLPQAIESCRNNKCNVQIIVVDDGSTDGTIEWLKTQTDICCLYQPHLGKCWAANKGFTVAKGKYIRFLDSDDRIGAFANDEQFDLVELTLADVVVSGFQSFNNEGILLNKQPWIETDDFIAQQLGECDSSHYSAYLFKKEFIKEIPHRPDFSFRDDRLFVLEVALKKPKIAIHKGIALLHRVAHHDRLQISSGEKHQIQNFQHLNIYKRILNQLNVENGLTKRRINASINILWPLCHWIAKYNVKEAANLFKWICELNPEFKIPDKDILGLMYNKLGFKTTERILGIRRIFKY